MPEPSSCKASGCYAIKPDLSQDGFRVDHHEGGAACSRGWWPKREEQGYGCRSAADNNRAIQGIFELRFAAWEGA